MDQIARASHHAVSQRLPLVQKTTNRPVHLRMLVQVVRDSQAQFAGPHDEHIPRASCGSQAAQAALPVGPSPFQKSAAVQDSRAPDRSRFQHREALQLQRSAQHQRRPEDGHAHASHLLTPVRPRAAQPARPAQ